MSSTTSPIPEIGLTMVAPGPSGSYGPVSVDVQERRRRVLRAFAIGSGIWFIVVGPLLAIALKLSLVAEGLVVVLPATGLGAIGAYIARPEKFRHR
jgi:hypothetical protein